MLISLKQEKTTDKVEKSFDDKLDYLRTCFFSKHHDTFDRIVKKSTIEKYCSAVNKPYVFDDYFWMFGEGDTLFSIVTNTYDKKLINFLEKVYPKNELVIDKDFVIQDIPIVDRIIYDLLVSVNGENFDYIISLSKELDPFEMEKLLLTLKKSKYHSFYDVWQNPCDTCKRHDENHPIHLEIAYNFTK